MNLDELKAESQELADRLVGAIEVTNRHLYIFDKEEELLRGMRRKLLDNIELINNYQKLLELTNDA